jgi:hypothetical protein
MLTDFDCDSKALADPPLRAYSAVMAFPGAVPAISAMMSVIVPVVVAVKYDIDCAFASFVS